MTRTNLNGVSQSVSILPTDQNTFFGSKVKILQFLFRYYIGQAIKSMMVVTHFFRTKLVQSSGNSTQFGCDHTCTLEKKQQQKQIKANSKHNNNKNSRTRLQKT